MGVRLGIAMKDYTMMMYRTCVTGLVVLLLALSPYNADVGRSKGPSSHTPAGSPAHGFALALTADNSAVALGQPVWITLEVRNVTGMLQYASTFARGDSEAFQFSVVNSSSHQVAARNPKSAFGSDSIGGPMSGLPVPATNSMFLKFQINELYEMPQAGTYVVRLENMRLRVNGRIVSMPASNSVSVTLR